MTFKPYQEIMKKLFQISTQDLRKLQESTTPRTLDQAVVLDHVRYTDALVIGLSEVLYAPILSPDTLDTLGYMVCLEKHQSDMIDLLVQNRSSLNSIDPSVMESIIDFQSSPVSLGGELSWGEHWDDDDDYFNDEDYEDDDDDYFDYNDDDDEI